MLRFNLAASRDISLVDLRIALINFIIAKKRDKGFILRVEDANEKQEAKRKDQESQELLKKFAINFDQTIYQSDHLRRYQNLALRLLEEKKAFLCTCEENKECYRDCKQMDSNSINKIQQNNTPFTLRLYKPDKTITFNDLIEKDLSFSPEEIGEIIILESNGTPSKDFACAVDDMIEGIDIVIQEKSDILDSAKEIHIQNSLNFKNQITYAHIPPLLKDIKVKELLEEGYLPDAIINTLLSLGTNPPTELFTLPKAIEWFDLEELSKEPVYFDIEKLKYINKEHLQRIDDLSLSRIFGFGDVGIGKLAKLYIDESVTIKNLESKIQTIFAPKLAIGTQKEQMQELSKLIFMAPMFDEFEDFKNYLLDNSNLQERQLLKLLSQLMTGRDDTSKLKEIYNCIKPYIMEITRCQH